MVFTSVVRLVKNIGPCEFWRKRRIFKLTAHFVGRRRNCYSVAVRNAHRSLQYTKTARDLKKADMIQLWETRLTGACQEHTYSYPLLRNPLSKLDVHLNRKTLADLSIWEPRTFKSIVSLAWTRAAQENLPGVQKLGPAPENVYVPKTED